MPETTNLSRRSLIALEILVAALVATLVLRAGFVTFSMPRWREQALANHLRTYVTRALRGVIYDSDGKVLVVNDDRDALAIIPADFPKDPLRCAETIAYLAQHAEVEPSDVGRVIEQYQYVYSPIVLTKTLTHDQKVNLLVRFPDHADGVTVVKNFSRRYMSTDAMSNVLGYVSRITAEEYPHLKDRYRPQDEIGKAGLEAALEDELRGDDEESRISVNAKGNKVATLATSPAVSGCDVALNMSATFQDQVQNVLERHLRAGGFNAGVAVVLDPRSGAVRALVSSPTYDNNLFANGVHGPAEIAEFTRLLDDPNQPFFNRAIGGVYPPGSTFKMVSASEALDARAVSVDERINSPGTITVSAELDPRLIYVYKDWKAAGHGPITVVDAIAESSDTFFYQVIGGYQTRRGLGPDPLAQGAEKFGFGAPLGIELSGEVGGTVPSPAWKNRVFTVDRKWFQGDTYNFAIGQGYLLSTPLQLAAATSVVANGGTLYRPQLVHQIRGCAQKRDILPYVIRSDVASADTLGLVRQGMRQAVTGEKGTAKAIRGAAISVAAKTGTAQYVNNSKEHAWFTMFAPYDHPEVVITVLVEGGGEGSLTALPVAADILDLLYRHRSS